MAIDVNQIAVVVRDAVAKVTAPLAARLKALESRPAMCFRGPWLPSEEYQAGDCVQRTKALHICIAKAGPDDVPGNSASWRRLASRETLNK